jgi:hypothetical protein
VRFVLSEAKSSAEQLTDASPVAKVDLDVDPGRSPRAV